MKKYTLLSVLIALPYLLKSQTILKQTVHFETNRFELTEAEEKTASNVLYTDTLTDIDSVVIKAYCDDRGSAHYNQLLSEKRAIYIASHIRKVNPLIAVKYYGEGELPLTAPGNPDKQRGEHRYAEITYYKSIKPLIVTKTPVAVMEAKPTATIPEIASQSSVLNDHQKIGDKITLNKILFIGGRHQLLPESYPELEALTNTLKENTKYNVCILGHICCVHDGSDGFDYDTGLENLSLARARVICEYLVKQGIDAKRLSYKGMRGNYPTGRGDKYDRRVEVEITGINK